MERLVFSKTRVGIPSRAGRTCPCIHVMPLCDTGQILWMNWSLLALRAKFVPLSILLPDLIRIVPFQNNEYVFWKSCYFCQPGRLYFTFTPLIILGGSYFFIWWLFHWTAWSCKTDADQEREDTHPILRGCKLCRTLNISLPNNLYYSRNAQYHSSDSSCSTTALVYIKWDLRLRSDDLMDYASI